MHLADQRSREARPGCEPRKRVFRLIGDERLPLPYTEMMHQVPVLGRQRRSAESFQQSAFLIIKATAGIEPAVRVLQTLALPLGDVAV